MHEFVHLPRYTLGNSASRVTPISLLHSDMAPASNTGAFWYTSVTIPGGTLANSGDFLLLDLAGLFSTSANQSEINLRMTSPSSTELIYALVDNLQNDQFVASFTIANSAGNTSCCGMVNVTGTYPTMKNQLHGAAIDFANDWTLRIGQYVISTVSPFSELQWRHKLALYVGKAP